MTRRSVVWLIPGLLALHNAEEALTFPRYLPKVRGNAPILMREIAASLDYRQLFAALVVVTVVPLLVSFWCARSPGSRAALWSVLLIQATVFLNVFAHLFSGLTVFHGYGPGLLTAVAVNLPFSLYLFQRARKQKWLSRGQTILLFPAALLLHGPGLIAAFAVAGFFSRA